MTEVNKQIAFTTVHLVILITFLRLCITEVSYNADAVTSSELRENLWHSAKTVVKEPVKKKHRAQGN